MLRFRAFCALFSFLCSPTHTWLFLLRTCLFLVCTWLFLLLATSSTSHREFQRSHNEKLGSAKGKPGAHAQGEAGRAMPFQLFHAVFRRLMTFFAFQALQAGPNEGPVCDSCMVRELSVGARPRYSFSQRQPAKREPGSSFCFDSERAHQNATSL